MNSLLEESKRVLNEADLLCTPEAVTAAFDRMALAMSQQLGDKNPLLLPIMNGGLVPAGLLIPRLDFPLTLDYLHATRYRNGTQGGGLDWRVKPPASIKDRVVVLIDDIFDEGITLEAIVADCLKAGAAQVYTAVLVEKEKPRNVDLKIDFVGLYIEDRYLFGCGMDYKGYLRNAAGIYAVKGL